MLVCSTCRFSLSFIKASLTFTSLMVKILSAAEAITFVIFAALIALAVDAALPAGTVT